MRHRNAGYSLFEVLLAFAIMAMILSVLLPRQTDMLTRMRNVDAQALAQDYAMSRIALLSISEPLLPGTMTDSYRSWTVVEDITSMSIAGTELTALNIKINVQDRRGTVLAEVETQVVPDDQP